MVLSKPKGRSLRRAYEESSCHWNAFISIDVWLFFHVKTPIVIDYQKYESIHPGIKKNDIELLLGSPQPDHTGATHLNTHQSPYHIIIKLSDPIIKLFGRSQTISHKNIFVKSNW